MSDIVRVPSIAYGADAQPSQAGDAPSRSLSGSAGEVTLMPGADAAWHPEHCVDNKADGSACHAHPVHGGVRCYGHLRSWKKSHPED